MGKEKEIITKITRKQKKITKVKTKLINRRKRPKKTLSENSG